MRLQADLQAVSITGKHAFLSALDKISEAFPDIRTRGRPSVAYPQKVTEGQH